MANLRSLFVGALCLATAAVALPQASYAAGGGEQIKAIVNGVVLTSGDISKRANFLKLRRTPGNLQKIASDEMVNEVLQRAEIIRLGVSVSTEDVDAAYERFAKTNRMTTQQLAAILDRAGIGVQHFKSYIGVQMSWPRAVQARFGANGRMSTQDFVARLRQDNGQKPTTNEYVLQQVIFVVPAAKRATAGNRKSEAEASRKKFPGCDQSKVFAAGYRDVSIRNVGRVLEPQLPEGWKADIIKAAAGGTTPAQVTDRGVEYIAICKKRQVSDDFAAQVVYEARDLQKAEKDSADPQSKKYLDELRKNATIVTR